MKRALLFCAIISALAFSSCEKESSSTTNTGIPSDTTSNLLVVGGQNLTVNLIGTDLFPNSSNRYYLIVDANGTSIMVIFNGGIPTSSSYTTTVNTIDAGKCRIVLLLDGGNDDYYANDGSTVSVSNVGSDKIKISFNTIGFTELGATGTPKTNTAKATFTCNKQ